jgi:sarcosine oxidase, subunit delta
MKLIPCPLNGPRPLDEFQYLGPVHPAPAQDGSDEAWTAWLFRDGPPAEQVVEWWRHTPSNTVFLIERHLHDDRVLRSYLPGATA